MEKKDLIISGFTGYRFENILPYIKSIDRHCSSADLVMVVGQTDKGTITKLTDMGWKVELVPNVSEVPIHVLRFLPMYEYLYNNYKNYRYVVSTDVKDVIFQSDPFIWLQDNLGTKKLVAGSEALKYCDEPWGNDNLRSTYGDYVFDRFAQNPIYNVGTLGGHAEYMKDLFFSLFYNSIGRPIPIVDQAVFNIMIQTLPYKDSVLFAEQSKGWACQAGTVADPAKMAYFRPNLLEAEPVWRDGKVYTNQGKLFTIVHQYDRVPEWRNIILEEYTKT